MSKVYPDIQEWSDERLRQTYERLSMDLWQEIREDARHFQAMGEVEREMRIREIDPEPIAQKAERAAQRRF